MPSPSPARAHDPSGILVIDKPAGMTSHDVVDELRRAFGWKKVDVRCAQTVSRIRRTIRLPTNRRRGPFNGAPGCPAVADAG